MDRKAGKTWIMVALLLIGVALTVNASIGKASQTAHALSSLLDSSAPPPKQWSTTYGGGGDDVAYCVVQTSDDGYALAGTTGSAGAGGFDFWLVKTNSSGKTEWSRTFGGTGDDEAFSTVQTSDGGYAVVGFTNSSGAGYYDFWLVKTDSSGNTQWSQTYGGIGDDEASSLVQTSDGGYALTGYTTSFAAGGRRFWLVKTDATGNMQWNKTYGGPGDNEATSLIKTSDGGYALAGTTDSTGAGGSDFWLVKTDAAGNVQWNETYGGAGDDVAQSVVQTSDGGYAVAGYTFSLSSGYDYFWLVKADAVGNVQWIQAYGGAGDNEAYSVVQTNDDGYAVAGYTNAFGAGGYDFWLVKTDSLGSTEWSQTYGGGNDDYGSSVIQTSDGGYAVAGFTDSSGAGGFDFYLVKIGAAGTSPGIDWNTIMQYAIVGIVVVIIIVAVAYVLLRRSRPAKSRMQPA